MTDFSSHAPGTFCYVELGTTDTEAAGRFYQGVFGWDRRDEDAGEFGVYTQFMLAGRVAAAMYEQPPEQVAQGIPPNWCAYVAVEDADADAARARELGANVICEPTDVYDYGRLAVLADPQGAVFSLWQTGKRCGLEAKDEPGALCWTELMTRDPAAATDFYQALFGWESRSMDMGEMGTYTMFGPAGAPPVCGMMPIGPEMENVPPHWMTYFQVEDVDAVHASALEAGGKTCVPPTDIPGAGRIAVIAGVTGETFGIYRGASEA